MSSSSIPSELREALALWVLGGSAAEARDTADRLLNAGHDSDEVRGIAAIRPETQWHSALNVVRPIVQPPGSLESATWEATVISLALREKCGRFLRGELSALGLTTWAHTHIGHDGPLPAQPLVEFDDELESAFNDSPTQDFIPQYHAALDTDIMAKTITLATQYLADTARI